MREQLLINREKEKNWDKQFYKNICKNNGQLLKI